MESQQIEPSYDTKEQYVKELRQFVGILEKWFGRAVNKEERGMIDSLIKNYEPSPRSFSDFYKALSKALAANDLSRYRSKE